MTTAGRFICPHCSAEFDTQELLKSHQQQVHLVSSQNGFRCAQCGEEFASRQNLVDHEREEHGRPASA